MVGYRIIPSMTARSSSRSDLKLWRCHGSLC